MSGPPNGTPPPAWLEPDDAHRHWERDLAHFPGQLTELDGELLRTFIGDGFQQAMTDAGLPFRFMVRRFWTYYYHHEGAAAVADEDRERVRAHVAAATERARTTIASRWRDEWLPEVHHHLGRWDAVDPFRLSRAALVTHLDETLERGARLWVVHFELVIALSTAKRAFAELYDELFEPATPLEAQVLLSGFDVLTTRAARALWPLRELVTDGPVREAFLRVAPRDALTELRAEPAAAPLLAALDRYLHEHGRRCPYLLFSAPSLAEEPASVMSMLRHMVERPDADPAHLLALQRERREAAERACRARLRFYPAPVRREFERRLADAQTAAVVGEDHNYLIDYTATAHVRRVLLACGAALARDGVLRGADDVFHLRVGELRAALLGDGDGLADVVAARVAELAHYASIEPPLDVHAPPPPDGDAGDDAPRDRDPGLLTGTAASAGVARGRARVVRSIDATGALRPGEVLVTPTTGQAWTPLFATAGALVTESGNLLSHAAVVAREYALPAVVALRGATTHIPDGALIEVDGGAGTVRLLDRR